MKLGTQFIAGALLLGLCAIIHIVVLSVGIEFVYQAGVALVEFRRIVRWIVVILIAFGVSLIGHTIQIWVWAVVLHVAGAIGTIGDAVYFSLVTSTTLGYGDITLDGNWRVFGALSAVTGLLTFGLSTAFLVGVMSNALKNGV